MHSNNRKENFIIGLILSVVVFINLFFGFYHLANFLTADEHYWIYERIPQYWNALENGNLKKTYINDKPGVSLAIISAPGYFLKKNSLTEAIEANKSLKSLDPYKNNDLRETLFYLRSPLIIFSAFMALFLFWIIKRLTDDKWLALWSVILIHLSPILIGISQILNPDALLWTFSSAAIFSYYALLKKDQKIYLLLTCLFLGLSFATKYVSGIILPFFLFLFVFYFFYNVRHQDLEKTQAYFKKQLSHYLAVLAGTSLCLAVLVPAIFIKPVYLYRIIFGPSGSFVILLIGFAFLLLLFCDMYFLKGKVIAIIQTLFNKYLSGALKLIPLLLVLAFIYLLIGRMNLFSWKLFENVPFDIKNLSDIKIPVALWQTFLLELNPWVFSLTPVVILLAVYGWIKLIFSKDSAYKFEIYTLSFFVIIFFSGYIFSETLATLRYSIMLYPLMGFLSAIALKNAFSKINKIGHLILISLILICISYASLAFSKPFYFNYTNIFLSKNKIITDSWGYGGYEAAQYLNSQPDSANLTIWSDYFGVCEFTRGNCLTKYTIDPAVAKIDYYVLTRRGKIRYPKSRDSVGANKYYASDNPAWELIIDGRPDNYIKVFKSTE
jgi:4-amino-4-deoxy-L-arabinose transferase-like glycosyltransferase